MVTISLLLQRRTYLFHAITKGTHELKIFWYILFQLKTLLGKITYVVHCQVSGTYAVILSYLQHYAQKYVSTYILKVPLIFTYSLYLMLDFIMVGKLDSQDRRVGENVHSWILKGGWEVDKVVKYIQHNI